MSGRGSYPLTPARLTLLLLLSATVLVAKDKKVYNEVSGDTVSLSAKAYTDPDAIKQLLGTDLGGHYIVVQLTVTPKGAKPLNVQLNDFQLFSENNGDRSGPQSPAEIAASDSLVLKRGESGIGSYGEEPGVKWSGVGMHSAGKKKDSDTTGPAASVKKGQKNDALKALLEQKSLPEKETAQPVSGLLYFPMEKQKVKDLALFYTVPDGKLRLSFR